MRIGFALRECFAQLSQLFNPANRCLRRQVLVQRLDGQGWTPLPNQVQQVDIRA